MDKTVADTISKECMEQYEAVRRSGLCNMFDRYCVTGAACAMGFDDLADLDRKGYTALLQNFGALMEYYGIEQ